MGALGDLRELHLVADQDEVAGGLPDSDGVRERELAGLVDEDVVKGAGQLLPTQEEGRTTDHAGAAGSGAGYVVVLQFADDALSHQLVVVVVAYLIETAGDSSALHLIRHRTKHVHDDLVALRRDGDACAVAQERHDHRGSGVGLPRARRALDAERAPVQPADQLARPPDRVVSLPHERTPVVVADTRRPASQQVVHRA